MYMCMYICIYIYVYIYIQYRHGTRTTVISARVLSVLVREGADLNFDPWCSCEMVRKMQPRSAAQDRAHGWLGRVHVVLTCNFNQSDLDPWCSSGFPHGASVRGCQANMLANGGSQRFFLFLSSLAHGPPPPFMILRCLDGARCKSWPRERCHPKGLSVLCLPGWQVVVTGLCAYGLVLVELLLLNCKMAGPKYVVAQSRNKRSRKQT